MRRLTIDIENEYAELLEKLAVDRGVSLETFLGSSLNIDVVRVFQQLERRWMPRTRWEELVRGERCPICCHLKADREVNDEGFKICDLGVSRLRLMRNQFIQGYCVVTCLEHVKEPYELEVSKQRIFFDDIMRAGRALQEVVKPDKMNFEILGNGVPHLHCHLKPRFHGDNAPGVPMDQNARANFLSFEQYAERTRLIRNSIDGIAGW